MSPQLLAQYVGSYTFKAPDDPNNVLKFNITRTGDTLSMDVGGKDPQEMIALSDETFSMMGIRLDFVKEGGDSHPSHLPHRGRGHEGDEGPMTYRQTKLAASSTLPAPLYLAT